MMIDAQMPTRIVFGAGRLDELAALDLPGSHALICTSKSERAERKALLDRVIGLLDGADVAATAYEGVTPNPTNEQVGEACALAKESGCDFVIGLGGGSSIDAAKAIAMMMRQDGDLWDYAYTGSGGKKDILQAAPVVAISTTAGTGTETDPYSVITNVETGEKLDFAADVLYPAVSIIDPELMVSLPEDQTIYQGIDALFHAAECAITNRAENRLVDVFAQESISHVLTWLPVVVKEPGNIEGRTMLAYAADICSGYTQSLINTTSHHIIAQTIGGMFPSVPHGASLIMIAEEYYKRIAAFVPDELDLVGAYLGVDPCNHLPGQSFAEGLARFFDRLGVRGLPLSDYGIAWEDLPAIADAAVNRTGIADVDLYTLTEEDVLGILQRSYR
ncbi:iron-containing alcohol dehydrogenase [Raoultibacter phocaeensis]|uniref:iron-containing alcohol dehydrogenase n=1 Tax=Raoultibacter phocaeensis TaxID=2479841 RepID=UPI00111A0E04|nr:iron-containing alcohol dehydrogenase [Raoultibacter phocaeensis]